MQGPAANGGWPTDHMLFLSSKSLQNSLHLSAYVCLYVSKRRVENTNTYTQLSSKPDELILQDRKEEFGEQRGILIPFDLEGAI